MIGRVAIALAIGGLAIAAFFVCLGPSVSTPSRALSWTPGPLDAGDLEVQFSVGGGDYLRARDATEPWWSAPWPSLVPRPTIEPGRFLLRSKNDGRSWRLER